MLALAVCWASAAGAQHQTLYYKVHFESDQHLLDTADKNLLNQLAVMAKQANYYEIDIQAHTDADADNAYNVQLSKLRAVSVKHYLAACGLKPEVLLTQAYGEKKPESTNQNNEGKAQNRRVEITLHTYCFNSSRELLQSLAPEYKQQLNMNASNGGELTGNDGTKIYFPANALVTADNKPVKGDVVVELSEFLHAQDAFYNQLSTTSNGRMLESGGMFSLAAYSNGQPVQVKPGANMRITIPAANARNNMMLFTPVTRADGVVDWQPTQVPFGAVPDENYDFTPRARVFLDNNLLTGLLVSNEAEPAGYASFTFPLIKLPKRPTAELTAPRYYPPVYERYFSFFTRLIHSRAYLMAKLEQETQRREQVYQKKLQTYMAQKKQYEEQLEQYLADSTRLVQNWTKEFTEWAQQQIPLHYSWAAYLNKNQWNNAIQDLIRLNGVEEFTSQPSLVRRFSDLTSTSNSIFTSAVIHQQSANALQVLQNMSYAEISKLMPHAKEINLRANARLRVAYTNKNNRLYSYSSACLSETPVLLSHLHVAQNDWLKRVNDEKNIAANKANYVYTTTINRFGTFNCDRFAETPPEQMAKIFVKHNGNAQVAFHIPSTGSFLYSYQTADGYYITIPKNTEATMVFLAVHPTEGPMLQVKKLKATQKELEFTAAPRTASVDEIRKALARI